MSPENSPMKSLMYHITVFFYQPDNDKTQIDLFVRVFVGSWMEERRLYGGWWVWAKACVPFPIWGRLLQLYSISLEKKIGNQTLFSWKGRGKLVLLLSKVKCYKCLLNLAWLLGEKTVLGALEVFLLGSLLFQFQTKFNYQGKLDFSLEYFLVIIFLM